MNVDFSSLLSIGVLIVSFVVGIGWSHSSVGKHLEKKAGATITDLFVKDVDSKLVATHVVPSSRVQIAVSDRLVSTDLSALDNQLNKS